MALLLTVLAVIGILVTSELWWRRHEEQEEFSRKFIHITVGSFVAFWPFFLSWGQIELLSLAFLLGIAASKFLNFFQAIHSVQRPTWGEVMFAAAVGIIALVTHDKWIYAAALLQMSLADGLAAVIGTRFGHKHKYLVFGHIKSVVGTVTFFVTSALILVGFSHWSGTHLWPIEIVGISALASIIENMAVKGVDNLLVPLAVALLLMAQ